MSTFKVKLPRVKVLCDGINFLLDVTDDFSTLVADDVDVTQVTVGPHNLDDTFPAKLSQHINILSHTI